MLSTIWSCSLLISTFSTFILHYVVPLILSSMVLLWPMNYVIIDFSILAQFFPLILSPWASHFKHLSEERLWSRLMWFLNLTLRWHRPSLFHLLWRFVEILLVSKSVTDPSTELKCILKVLVLLVSISIFFYFKIPLDYILEGNIDLLLFNCAFIE